MIVYYIMRGDGAAHKKGWFVMPLEVMDKIIKMIPENYIIYDPFCGSGTTIIAAINNNRKYIGCEISKKYFELAQRRIKEETLQTKLF